MLRYSLESLWRNRGRYLLFGILFTLLGGAWLITLLLGSAADALREDLIDRFGRAILVEKAGTVGEPPSEATYARFDHPELVEAVEVIEYVQTNIIAGFGETVHEEDVYAELDADSLLSGGIPSSTGFNKQIINMVGYDYSRPYSPFTDRENPCPLTRGRLPEQAGECLIFDDDYDLLVRSERLSGLGDVLRRPIYVAGPDEPYRIGYTNSIMINADFAFMMELTVVGTVSREATGAGQYRIADRWKLFADGKTGKTSNEMPIFFVTLEEARRYPSIGQTEGGTLAATDGLLPDLQMTASMKAIFHLHDFDDLAAFEAHVEAVNAELREEILAQEIVLSPDGTVRADDLHTWQTRRRNPPTYCATTYLDGFADLVSPLETLGEMSARMALNLTLLAAAFFAILTVLGLYARTYEIGVLRCVGMSRLAITASLTLEQGIFLGCALLCGIALGSALAGTVLTLLVDEIYRDFFVATLHDIPHAAGRILLAGFLISLAASLMSAAFIQRCRPLAILRNRN